MLLTSVMVGKWKEFVLWGGMYFWMSGVLKCAIFCYMLNLLNISVFVIMLLHTK